MKLLDFLLEITDATTIITSIAKDCVCRQGWMPFRRKEERHMVKVGRLTALSARAYFFRAIPQKDYIIFPIILDTHSVYHILCDLLCFPKAKGRAFMADQKDQPEQTADEPTNSAARSQDKERIEKLREQEEQAKKTQETSKTPAAPFQAEEQLEQMKKKEEQDKKAQEASTISEVWIETKERRELLKTYAIDAIVGVVIFLIFVGTSIVVEFIARITGQFGILIRIVGWSISSLGAICGIGLAIRNAYDFLKLLLKSPPKLTTDQKINDEGRTT